MVCAVHRVNMHSVQELYAQCTGLLCTCTRLLCTVYKVDMYSVHGWHGQCTGMVCSVQGCYALCTGLICSVYIVQGWYAQCKGLICTMYTIHCTGLICTVQFTRLVFTMKCKSLMFIWKVYTVRCTYHTALLNITDLPHFQYKCSRFFTRGCRGSTYKLFKLSL